jgi:quercetin dioxygenase-like cupin family protein
LSLDGRFERFADQAGRLRDLGEDDARTVLNRIDQPADWYGDPKVGPTAMLWIEGGPGVRDAVTGFVRVMAGEDFPEHKHIGQEHVLVMQGSLIDSLDGKRHGPGEVIPQPPGSQHSFHVPEDGPDLLILSVVQEAVEIDGQRLGPDDRLG